ncbi:terpenoid synthase [Penicillium herquei]|nr:terpenoid synthase [Penicillium herquei]
MGNVKSIPSGADASISSHQFTQIIERFVQGVNIDVQPNNDALIEEYIFKQLLEEGVEEKSAMIHAVRGALVSRQFYPFQPPELRRLTGLYTAYFFVLDDTNSVQGRSDMLQFRRNLLENRPMPKPFQGCAALFKELDEHYLEFIANRAVLGLINHMDSTALEDGEMGKFSHLQKSSAFPHYFRWMTGNPEPFVYFAAPKDVCAGYDKALNLFIQAAPELCDFTNHTNDLFSFYKEAILSSEHDGYVYHRVQAEKISVVECLNRIVDELHARIRRIEATVASDSELSKIVMGYVRGYLGFHITEPRYKISELNVPSLKARIK